MEPILSCLLGFLGFFVFVPLGFWQRLELLFWSGPGPGWVSALEAAHSADSVVSVDSRPWCVALTAVALCVTCAWWSLCREEEGMKSARFPGDSVLPRFSVRSGCALGSFCCFEEHLVDI